MKAIIQDRYGPAEEVLRLQEIDVPGVGDDEVLVRVRAASVHPDVWHVVTGRPYVLRLMGAGLRRPVNKIPGTDLAGRVETVGSNVTRFKPGDEVFGESHRGFQWQNGGTFAEYVSVPEDVLSLKPPNVTFEEAAAVPTSGIIALHNLQNGKRLREGQRVLINGAAGGVGSIALQFARACGAHVTGVDSTQKLDIVRSLGAERVIDFTREDFARRGERYDLILDVASNLSLSDFKRALTPAGIYILIGHDHFGKGRGRLLGSLPQAFGLMALSPFVRHLPPPEFSVASKKETMAILKELLETRKLTPIIDRAYLLSEASLALRYLESGNARGRIVITP